MQFRKAQLRKSPLVPRFSAFVPIGADFYVGSLSVLHHAVPIGGAPRNGRLVARFGTKSASEKEPGMADDDEIEWHKD